MRSLTNLGKRIHQVTSTFAFLGVICSLLGITAGIDFFREKYESSRKIPDVLNLFRYFKRRQYRDWETDRKSVV